MNTMLRKFMELQNVNLKNYFDGSKLDKKFNNLKWVSPHYASNPNKELDLLKDAAEKVAQIKTKRWSRHIIILLIFT